MNRSHAIAVALTSAIATALALLPVGPVAAADGPDLDARAEPVVGAQIGPSDQLDEDVFNDYTRVPFRISWRSTSRVYQYDVLSVIAGGPPGLLASFDSGPDDPTSLTGELRDYFGDFGGGSQERVGWRVEAMDGAGNVTGQDVGRRPRVIQENGASPNSSLYADVTRGPAWRVGRCACASGGERVYTKRRGAPVRIVLDEGFNPARGNQIGLVLTQGPARGEVAIFVDGRRRAVVDAYAPRRRDRVLAWTGAVPAGVPVVVRNQATPGRPRADVDAFVLF